MRVLWRPRMSGVLPTVPNFGGQLCRVNLTVLVGHFVNEHFDCLFQRKFGDTRVSGRAVSWTNEFVRREVLMIDDRRDACGGF